jgi:hypothetical protein
MKAAYLRLEASADDVPGFTSEQPRDPKLQLLLLAPYKSEYPTRVLGIKETHHLPLGPPVENFWLRRQVSAVEQGISLDTLQMREWTIKMSTVKGART